MKKTIAALGLLACTNTFALTVDINVDVFQKVLFEKVDANTLHKIHASVEVSAKGIVKEGTQVAEINNSAPAEYDRNRDMTLKIIDKHSVKLTDSTDGIDEVVTASIDKSMFGKIKSLNIKKEIYESLYNKQLEALGGSIFGSMGVSADNVALNFSLELSDFECGKENDGLVECSQSLKFSVSGSDEIVNENTVAQNNEKAKKEVASAINVVNSYVGNLVYSTKYDISSYITILKEIRREVESTEGKISDIETARMVKIFNSNITNEILDSYNYNTASGKYIEEMFESYLSDLKKIQKEL